MIKLEDDPWAVNISKGDTQCDHVTPNGFIHPGEDIMLELERVGYLCCTLKRGHEAHGIPHRTVYDLERQPADWFPLDAAKKSSSTDKDR